MPDVATLQLRVDASGMVSGGQQSERALKSVGDAAQQAERRVLTLAGVTRAGFDAVGVSARSLGNDLLHLGAGFGAAFTSFEGIQKFIHETSEAQYATAQLEAVIKSTGGSAGRTVEEMEKLAKSLQDTTTFTDEAVSAAESLLAAFDNIKGDTFDRATKGATDLAARMGGDVAGAAELLGKALQRPDQGLEQLNRRFRLFSESQKDTIADMVQSGQTAEAQGIILDKLAERFGGAAAAARGTLGGALQGLKHDFGELFEATKGDTSGLIDGITGLDSILKAIKPHIGEVVTAAEALAVAFGARALSSGVAALAQWTNGLIVARAETLAYGEAGVVAARSQLLQAESAAASAASAAASARVQAAVVTGLTARIAAQEALLVANGQLVAADAAVVAGQAAVTTALAATSLGARAATAAMGFLNGALALVGGPIGAIAIGTFLLLRSAFQNDGEAARRAASDLDTYKAALSGVSAEQQRAQLVADQLLIKQLEARKAQTQQQIDALPKSAGVSLAAGEFPTADVITPLSALHDQLRSDDAAVTALKAHVEDLTGSLTRQGETSDDVTRKSRELTDGLTAERDKLIAINGAYGQSELAIKLLEIGYDGLEKKRKALADLAALKLDAGGYAAAKKIIEDVTGAITDLQITAAKNAVITAREIDVASYTAANAALVQAAANESTLTDATNKAAQAQEADKAAVAHLWAEVLVGTRATRDAIAADVAATAAVHDRTAALEHLKTAQDAATQLTAAETEFKKASYHADSDGLNAAAQAYSERALAIIQQRFLRDATIDATNAAQKQADVTAQTAGNTAFRDSVTAQIAATERQTTALLEEAEASAHGQSAIDALRVSRAADAAVIALQTDAAREHKTATEDEIEAVRASVSANERAALAVAKFAEQQKLLSQPLENFVKSTQADLAKAFEDVFTDAGTAAENFWKSFRDVAFKTLGEIAAYATEKAIVGKFAGTGLDIPTGPRTVPGPQQFREDGTPLAAGSGAQTIVAQAGAPTDNQQLAYFAAAAAGVTLVADAMNKLAGVSHQTASQLDAQIQSAIGAVASIAAYGKELTATDLQKSIDQSKARADALRQEVNDGFPGLRLQEQREGLLRQIDVLEAERNKQLQDEFALKQREATEDANIRTLRAQGLTAQADALANAEAAQREYAAAVKDGADTVRLLALATAQKAEADRRARDLQDQQAVRDLNLGARRIAATGGSDRQVDDARFVAGQIQELAALRKTGTQEEIDALYALLALEATKRAAEFEAFQQRAREDYAVRQLQAEGHTAEAAALRLQLDQQREYQDAVKAGLDDATLAALALAQAAEGAAAAAKQAQDAQRALDDLQVRALTAQGNTSGADQLRFQLQQQRELEDAIAAGQSQDYIDKLKQVQALEAQARAAQAAAAIPGAVNNVASAQPSGETTSIANAARTITEVTGNRMADYLASILIVEREQLNLWKGFAGTPPIVPPPSVSTTINNTANTTQLPSDGASGLLASIYAVERDQLALWRTFAGQQFDLSSQRAPSFDKIDTGALERWTGGGQASATATPQRPIIQVNATFNLTQQPGEDQDSLVRRIVDEATPQIAEKVNEQLAAFQAQQAQRDGNPLVTNG